MPDLDPRSRPVPVRGLALSFAALAVPVLGALVFPDTLGEYGALLWLLALIPGFLLSYYRSWRGVATSLAVGMAVLSLTQATASVMLLRIPDTLMGIVVAYLAISMGIGFLANVFHQDRAIVEDMAFTDSLTRLPNRRHAQVFLENEFAAAERGRMLTVVMFDLDAFKTFNDTHGHSAGDEAIRAFADVLARTTRRMNLSARYGGEEFISVLAGSDIPGSTVFAERVRMAFKAQHMGDPPLTVSAGVATWRTGMETPEALISAADEALYEAKRGGRNQVRVATEERIVDAEAAIAELGVRTRPSEELELATEGEAARFGSRFGEGRRILVAEGEEKSRTVLRDYLASEGFNVVPAADARSALLALRDEFDVVLSSLRLPGASGHEVVFKVKEVHPLTQIVVMAGIQDSRVASEALQAGADRYLFRPFGMPELQGHLLDALVQRDKLTAQAGANVRSSEAEERDRESREAVVRGTRALVRAVEARDPYTRGHSARVAAYARALADHIDPDEILLDRGRLQLACELHDVGKIAVPDEVLNKSGSLQREEMQEIHGYPRAGRRILEPLLDDDLVLGVVNWHHERWDGGGYPDGLQGDAIPLAARIVAVADALDAMTCPRAYRDALPWDDAFSRLLADEGEAFDPEVVAAAASVSGSLLAIFSGATEARTEA